MRERLGCGGFLTAGCFQSDGAKQGKRQARDVFLKKIK